MYTETSYEMAPTNFVDLDPNKPKRTSRLSSSAVVQGINRLISQCIDSSVQPKMSSFVNFNTIYFGSHSTKSSEGRQNTRVATYFHSFFPNKHQLSFPFPKPVTQNPTLLPTLAHVPPAVVPTCAAKRDPEHMWDKTTQCSGVHNNSN